MTLRRIDEYEFINLENGFIPERGLKHSKNSIQWICRVF